MKRRARLITTHEGKYVNLEDMKEALRDDEFVNECAAMLLVAHKRGDGMTEGLRRTIGNAIMIMAGEGRES